MADFARRLEVLKEAHKHQHKIVEALIGERAPASSIAEAKIKKLNLKDQIARIENGEHNEH